MTQVIIAEPVTRVTVAGTEITVQVVEQSTAVTVAAGVTDHGALSGLADDDHAQYLTTARHAAIGSNPHGVTASDVGALPLSGGTMTGALVLDGDPAQALEAATKQYVDNNAGGASDVGDLTTVGLTAGNMLRVAVAGGLEERTPAQVLADIGAAASGHNHDASYVNVSGDTMTGALSITVTTGTPLTVRGVSGGYAFRQLRHDGPELFRIDNQGIIDGGVRGYVHIGDNLRTGVDRYVLFGSGGVSVRGGSNSGSIAHGMYSANGTDWTRSVASNYLGGFNFGSSVSGFGLTLWHTSTTTSTDLNGAMLISCNPSQWNGYRLKLRPHFGAQINFQPINSIIDAVDVDDVTDAVTDIVTAGHTSTGTPAAGFGAGLLYQLKSSTTENRNAARIAAVWQTATDASRKADLVLSAFDTAEREGLRIRATGSAALLITDLPTSDPGVTGALWSDSGTVKVSSG